LNNFYTFQTFFSFATDKGWTGWRRPAALLTSALRAFKPGSPAGEGWLLIAGLLTGNQ
jgi:hypothetical protein